MYKKASDGAQSTTRRHPLLDTANTGGIDDSVWARKIRTEINDTALDDPQAERDRLVMLKRSLEDKVRLLGETIGNAQRAFMRSGARSSHFGRWHDERK